MGETHESACALRVSAVGADVAVGGRGGGGDGGGGGVEEHVDACDAAGVTAGLGFTTLPETRSCG